MARYKHHQFFKHYDDTLFDDLHKAGARAPHSGIYRCNGCGQEIVMEEGQTLPPENHHQHPNQYLVILWQLVVTPT